MALNIRMSRIIQVAVFIALTFIFSQWAWRNVPQTRALLPKPWMPPKPEDTGDIQKAIIVPAVEMSEIQWLKKRE